MTKFLTFTGFAVAGLVAGWLVYANVQTLGGVYNNQTALGPNGTLTSSDIWTGTGTMIATSFTVAATSSTAVDVAVPGVLSTDMFVQVSLATTSAANFGWFVSGASASTTNGYITFRLNNGTGGSTVVPASIASSSVKVRVVR